MTRKHPHSMDLYWDDLLAGTLDMTDEEFGCYVRMMGKNWTKHLLSSAYLEQRVSGLSDLGRERVLEKFERDSEGNGYQPRVIEEYKKKQKIREKRSVAGKQGGRPSGEKHLLSKSKANRKMEDGNKNNKNGVAKSARNFPDWFTRFWKAYPLNPSGRRPGKAKTLALALRVPEADRELLALAAANYAKDCGEFVRHPERFVRDDFWRDYIGKPESAAPAPRKPKQITADQARHWLIRVAKLSDARDWPDDRCLREYQGKQPTTAETK